MINLKWRSKKKYPAKINVPGLSRGANSFGAKNLTNIRGIKQLSFTSHSRAKMRQYGLSESRIKRVMHTPKRTEKGIAPKTIAMMQPSFVKTTDRKESWKQEIWIMFAEDKKERRIISAWRYPGMTKLGEPLPEEILKEIRSVI